jgi:diguanylate cyclase (GGDEF)-like protein/PAS domain S-box-containing protein
VVFWQLLPSCWIYVRPIEFAPGPRPVRSGTSFARLPGEEGRRARDAVPRNESGRTINKIDGNLAKSIMTPVAGETAADGAVADVLFLGPENASNDPLVSALRDRNLTVRTLNGADGAAAVTYSVGAVVIDHTVGEVNGIETLDLVRRNYTDEQVPVILVATGIAVDDCAEALSHGANDVVDRTGALALAVQRIDDHVATARLRRQLKKSQDRLTLAIEGSNDGIWDWDIDAGTLQLSHRWYEILGIRHGRDTVDPDYWLDRIHDDERNSVLTDLRASLDGLSDRFSSEHRIRHENGTYRWVHVHAAVARNADGEAIGIAGSMTDITDRKAIDRLTGLPNRGPLSARIDRTLGRIRRHPGAAAALYAINIDGVGMINEGYGEAVGNMVLKTIAGRLTSTLRPTDVVASFGGDEFGVFLDRIDDPSDSLRVGKRIQEVISETIECEGRTINLTSGIGIVVSTERHVCGTDMISEAFTALKRAKKSGKGNISLFDEKMEMSAARRLDIERELRTGIDNGDIVLAYQPIFNLNTGELTGFESLARWFHPERGMVSPGEFIPVAEESGLIVPMTTHLIEVAAERAAAWNEKYANGRPFFLSVNLSAQNLETPQLIKETQDAFDRFGAPLSCLKIEVTESQMMKDFDGGRRRLEEFREAGVNIAIDDFGTGYSSLSYLTQLPFDMLKIDRSFIMDADLSAEKQKILHAIAALGQSLDMAIVGEGVERIGEHEIIKGLNMEACQGFFYGKPALPDDLDSLLSEWGIDMDALC